MRILSRIILVCLLSILFSPQFSDAIYTVQIASLSGRQGVADTISRLSDQGIKCFDIQQSGYIKIRCGSTESYKKAEELKQVLAASGYKDAFIVASSTKMKSEKTAAEQPIGEEGISGEIFERRGGYFHPFLSITGYYTDNVFNTNDDEKDDYVAVISPGIWLSVPRIKEQLFELTTSSVTPGGMSTTRLRKRFPRRYQTYLLYTADIEQFKKYSSENTINHKIEGLFQYNFRGGLSVDLYEQFIKTHDERGTGVSTELDKYNTNLAGITASYDISRRFRIRLDYSNYYVNYKDTRNDFRDRVDNSINTYLFYKFLPKTSAFVEYDYLDIHYRKGILDDSVEHHFLGGLQWEITGKSRGTAKAGYGIKDFENSDIDTARELFLELQLEHNFTPKTSLKLIGTRRTNETNISVTDYILTHSITAEYLQRLTSKISSAIDLSYQHDKYKGELTFGGKTDERKDNIYRASVAFDYGFRDWLKFDLGYIYTKRDSNFSDFDYTNNTVFFRVTGSL
ncbi:MAG TPA: DUF560 domain-containing protein [Nitrospirae bacterium]|nr:DUF560 domain-containing protein [Nitrospirota bacterium]